MRKFKKVAALFLTLALMLTMLIPGTAVMAEESASTVDLCLNSDGSLRGGVKVYAGGDFWTQKGDQTDIAQDASKFDAAYWNKFPLKNMLLDNDYGVFYQGAGKTENPGYIQIDLGNVKALSKIEYTTYDSAAYYGFSYKVMLSNDKTFSNTAMVKTIWEVTQNGTTLSTTEANTYTLNPAEDRYQYIRIQAIDTRSSLNAKLIKVYGSGETYPQDLIHDVNGSVLNGVGVTYTGTPYADHAVAEDKDKGMYANPNNAIDNKHTYMYNDGVMDYNSATAFIAENGEKGGYVQLDLGENKILSKLRVQPFSGAKTNSDPYFRSGLKVVASSSSDFANPTVLAGPNSTALSSNDWIEYTAEDLSVECRYVRIIQSDRAGLLGINEIQAEGYNICDAKVVGCNVPSGKTITNIENNINMAGSGGTTYYLPLIVFELSGKVDADTVTAQSVVVEGSNIASYTPWAEGNKIFVDPSCLPGWSSVTVKITSDVECDGISVEPYTATVSTDLIAPVAYDADKAIVNIAKGKTVTSGYEGLIGQNYVNVKLPQNTTTTIDLGSVDKIEGIGWYLANSYSMNGASVYLSDDKENLTKNSVYTFGMNELAGGGKGLNEPINARYVSIVTPDVEWDYAIQEFLVYKSAGEAKFVFSNVAEGAEFVTNVSSPETVKPNHTQTVLTKPIELVYGENIDAASVNDTNVTVTCQPIDNDKFTEPYAVTCNPTADGNKILIDPAYLVPYSDVTITVTSGVTSGSVPVKEHTLKFKTSPVIAPVLYREGKKIVNAAAGKTAYFDNITAGDGTDSWGVYVDKSIEGTKTPAVINGQAYLTDSDVFNSPLDSHSPSVAKYLPKYGERNLVIDLGSEYEVAGYGWAKVHALYHFHSANFFVGNKLSGEDMVQNASKGAYSASSAEDMNYYGNVAADHNINGRFVTIAAVSDGIELFPGEIMVYAYADADSDADLYFTTGITEKTVTANARLANGTNGVLVVAIYKGNDFVSAKVSTSSETTQAVTVSPEEGQTVKAFLFDNMDSIKPLTEAISY